jgi:myb proto-oncogene protein
VDVQINGQQTKTSSSRMRYKRTLVPGRTINQCNNRWRDGLDSTSIDGANGRTGKWSKDEDSKLKDAVQEHGGKDWAAISALVPGRTKTQCLSRWHDALNPNISLTGTRKGNLTAVEDSKLKDGIETHGDKDWVAISAPVPRRTGKQCHQRWHGSFSIGGPSRRTGRWTAVEDTKLKDAVDTHGDKDWGAISELVPGRTRKQCRCRWINALDPNIGRASGRKGEWTEDEDTKLKDAVQRHGGKNWAAIAVLVPGRTKIQCQKKWQVLGKQE